MFERPQSGERAVLVHAGPGGAPEVSERSEFAELARSAGAIIVDEIVSARKRPEPRFLIGKGKVEELRASVKANDAELVIFGSPLSPSQERNLERELKCRVLDRAGLILDIFAQRARSFEGKLQVELAQLRHLSTRLVRGWTHLERQKGGIGLRGPGETQLETDRRLLGRRIRQLNERLEHVDARRTMNRRNRVRAEVPTVALVGYTNAGKSSLMNRLTGADVLVEDRLFATLDATLRRLDLGDGRVVALSDTVGFVRKLPHGLVEAFRSTLEETAQAALLLHVVDAAHPEAIEQIDAVREVLAEIGADEVREVIVLNQIDRADPDALADLEHAVRAMRHADPVRVSAWTGEGAEALVARIAHELPDPRETVAVHLPYAREDLVARVHREGRVVTIEHDAEGTRLVAEVGPSLAAELRAADLGSGVVGNAVSAPNAGR